MTTEKEISATSAVLNDKRGIIVQAMAGYIARPNHGTPTEEHNKVAGTLFDATVATFTGASPAVRLPAEVERGSITRFGDGLVPILKDAIGPDLPGSSLSRLSDAYWRMVNSIGVPAA